MTAQPQFDPVANAVLAEARQWVGTPYVHQASVKRQGCDFLGLIRGVWRALYGREPESLPGYSRDWGEISGDEPVLKLAGIHLTQIEPGQMAAGDLLVFRWQAHGTARHMGILSPAGRFIHAWERGGVVEVSLVPAWRRRIAGVFRFPQQTGIAA